MESDTHARLAALEVKLDAILSSVQKTEKYFKLTFWITVIFLVGPLLLMAFVIPSLMRQMSSLVSIL